MKREQKTAVVEEIAGQIESADSIFAIDYRGISVPQAAELRTKLREADASFRVVKNRLTKLAAQKAGREDLVAMLDGPTALTFVRGDIALAAKAITTLDRDWEVLEYKGGLMDGEVLEPDQFKAIARLPGREQLNAQFAAMVASPLSGLVRGLNALLAGVAIQLRQVADQGLVSGEPPAEEAAAEEAPAETAEEAPVETAEEPAPAEEAPAETAEEPAPAEEAPAETAEEPAPAEEQPEAEAPAEEPKAEAPAEEQPAEGETANDENPPAADAGASEQDSQ